ncbi:diguanylate cyclase (GGDEF) domain-containing protein [Nocardioides terrae]|uniref:Diguanylate cyclase (GGDEF) domain-containing protein n=1 Tax=Nocardioides terrae TaxID=574651 RepID=A0A1I1L5Y4_9ACTN|nr:bifunctional diguanylate cyclase/phosphodiesterase [Nocardioides terrae]SFC65833.1 diguanylate cyclase (GGDEF) domain-containing protein [Nocardioides terrae]
MKWRSLGSSGGSPAGAYRRAPALATMTTLSRSTGAFYLLGGIGSLLPDGDFVVSPAKQLGIATIGYVAIAVGLALLLTGRRWPRPSYHVIVVGGTWMIAGSIMLGKGSASAEDPLILFALPLIASAAFFSWRGAVVQGVIVLVTAVVAMLYVGALPAHIVIFVAGLACVGGAVAWLSRLNERVEEDPLTRLGNRRAMARHLEAAVDHATRGGPGLAVVMLDLDHFKAANDSGGHAAGDDLLVDCATRWRTIVPDSRLLFRYGGDEFAVLLPGFALGEATELAERLRTGLPRGATASIGVAAWQRGDSSSLLVGRADVALYEAKAGGRDRTVAYGDPGHGAREIEDALRSGQFVLHYQPVISLADGTVRGIEALIRWQHPERGLLAPAEFLAVAERTGSIRELGAWTLGQACTTGMSGPADHAVSVNVTITELRQPCYAAMVAQTLERTGLDPRRLVMEVTEGVYAEHDQQVISTLGDLRGLGVLVALDDFGSGWSSLRWLTSFPVDILKIDGSFVHAIDEPGSRLEVLSAIIKLGKELGLHVVGEQVETENQARVLRELGCDSAQGFHLGRPEPRSTRPYPAEPPIARSASAPTP